MTLPSDQWLWILDDDLVRTLLSASATAAGLAARAAAHPALVTAMRHWMRAESEAALAALDPALAQNDPDALLLAAQLSFESGDPVQAAALYQRLAAAVPEHPYAHFNRGLCLARLEQWEDAAAALQRAVLLAPSHAEAWFVLGVSLLRLDRIPEAASAFSQCLALRPGYVPASCGLAAALQLQDKPAEALALYLPILDSSPNREEILVNSVAAAVAAADWPAARRLAARLLDISPGAPLALESLAHSAFATERFQEALALFIQLSQAAPAFFDHWFHIGLCQQRLGRFFEAASAFETALQIDAGHPAALLAFADSLFQAGDSARALAAFQSSLRLNPASPQAWLRLGLLQSASGDANAAEQSLAAALDHGADGSDPALSQLRAALACLVHQQSGAPCAVHLYSLAVAAIPDDAVLLFNYGAALAALDRLEEARQAWKSAIALRPELASKLLEELGQASFEPAMDPSDP